jgi:hypothetical protein
MLFVQIALIALIMCLMYVTRVSVQPILLKTVKGRRRGFAKECQNIRSVGLM